MWTPCLNVSTTPLRQWVFHQCLPFSWTTLRGKHWRHPIAIMGVVDTFEHYWLSVTFNYIILLHCHSPTIIYCVIRQWCSSHKSTRNLPQRVSGKKDQINGISSALLLVEWLQIPLICSILSGLWQLNRWRTTQYAFAKRSQSGPIA